MNDDNNARNTIIFFVLAVTLLIGYQVLVLGPAAERRRAAQENARAEQVQNPDANPGAGLTAPTEGVVHVDRRQAVSASPRVAIQTPSLRGSISLRGARIDDLYLTQYRETLESDANVELLRPVGAEGAYFATSGWTGQNVPGLPGPDTLWTQTSQGPLSPGNPVVLTYDNGQGLVFTRTISVDDQYMFTIADTVVNRTGQALTLAPFGSIRRIGLPDGAGRDMISHEGAVGVLDDRLVLEKYKDWRKEGRIVRETTGGWLGVSDKYWMAALIPDQRRPVEAEFRVTGGEENPTYQANFLGEAMTVAPGATVTNTTRLFAGAKRAEVLRGYSQSLGVPDLDNAIDWGMFWFLTRPIFLLLEWFYGLVGNFGVAILLLTVVVKIVFFPLANKSFESMSKMKKLAPQMEEIKKRHKDDPAKMQQETLALYQREKINPVAGCLPLLVQIPVFYALYKVLFVTIEMRHAPFFGWIQDLSARDPLSIWNAFGLFPWDPAAMGGFIGGILNGPLHLGPVVLLYGFTMWLMTSMNPPAPDPVQRQIFGLMPILFTFIMAPFAVGLLVYWVWNNILSILQQYVIMHRNGVENPIDGAIARLRGGGKAAP
ncbi:membrane protein insertase YidC [Brevundimonas sp. 2R-24]|uniref:Membrane protein insertase YidC n=1 Tax=Peiella sedimenti TaxID=3061083 RepID=A0ABT8SKY5_9CAUL|nr:membrane protein insertase YidC [Caulobacteraceae bacterium XZ-24]